MIEKVKKLLIKLGLVYRDENDKREQEKWANRY